MKVLALDLAIVTGWALGDERARDGRTFESGYETFDLRRGDSAGWRYLAFTRWLEAIIRPGELGLVVYEQPFAMKSGQATEIAMGFATRVQQRCAEVTLEHTAVVGSLLKKWTTGKGNAKKDAMVEAVARRWRRVDDHNEADAVALLQYAFTELVPAART